MGRPRAVGPAVAVALLAVAACSSGSTSNDATPAATDAVTVASFNFSESELLAEMYSQVLEAEGIPVERSFDVGPRELVVPALVGGLVDMVPEYAGTALEFLSAGRDVPGSDGEATSAALRRATASLPIQVLAPAPAQDANTFVVTRATAERYGLVALSDLGAVAGELVFGGPPECPSRPLCLPGLEGVYGITFREAVALDASGPLTHQAIDEGVIDVALLFTTDPSLGESGLVELADDRDLQPAENVTPIVHADAVAQWGDRLTDPIDATSARLTTVALRRLNQQVASGEADIPTVAAQWLASQGLA